MLNFPKIKKYANIVVWISAPIMLLSILFLTDMMFYKITSNSIEIGFGQHQESVYETIQNNERALKEADVLIEDARKRGFLE